MSDQPRSIYCIKLKKESIGLEVAPYPGPLGQKIYQHISKEAWSEWLGYLTMLINEGRLALDQTKVKEMLKSEMIEFLHLNEVE